MSEKHLVCQGAVCTCIFGTTPDNLVVHTQNHQYINDAEGKEKLMATHKDTGQTFKKNNFGNCKKLNNNPCKVNVTEWRGFYEKITIQMNDGHALLEDSKAICAIGGVPCIEIRFHGQKATVSSHSAENVNPDMQAALNPLVDVRKVNGGNNNIETEVA